MKQTDQQYNIHVHTLTKDYLYGYIILISSKWDRFQKGSKPPQRGQQMEPTPKVCAQSRTNRVTDSVSLQRWSTSQSLELARHPQWESKILLKVCVENSTCLGKEMYVQHGKFSEKGSILASFLYHTYVRGHRTGHHLCAQPIDAVNFNFSIQNSQQTIMFSILSDKFLFFQNVFLFWQLRWPMAVTDSYLLRMFPLFVEKRENLQQYLKIV